MIQLSKRYVTIGVSVLAALTLLAAYGLISGVIASGAPDASLGPLSPNRSSSEPFGAHTFLMRKNNLGVNDQLQIKAYYPADTDWGRQYIYIDPYLTCDVDFDTDDRPGSSVTYMSVSISAGGRTETYNIKIDRQTGLNNVCTVTDGRINDVGDNGNDKNKLFARYPLPGSKPPVSTDTQLIEVTVEIAYSSIVTQPVKSDAHNNQQRFYVRAQTKSGGSYDETSGVLLGPTGGNDGGIANSKFNFPIMGRPEDYGSLTQISVPFGLPCNATSSQIKSVGVYDSDDFGGPAVRFRVKDLGDGDSGATYDVPFRNGVNPKPGTPTSGNFRSDWFTPNQDNKNRSSVEITMEPDHRYQLEVVNIDGGNTIVVNVPTETVYGVIGCGWKMRPDSSVSPTIQQPGRPVTFTHTATNTGKFKSDPVTSKVKWGKTGVLTTGTVSTDTDSVYNPNNGTVDRTFTNTYTIPAGATDGQQYCQYLEVKPHSKKDSSAYDSWMKGDRACVTVQRPIIPDQEVGIAPVVNGNMEYIEPTETATFDGYVNVTNFPQLWDDEWGYTEAARQRPATRVTATASGGLEQDGPYSMPATANTTYSCPHGADSRSGSTCTHSYGGSANDTRAECVANGHNWSGGSCTDTHAADSNTTYSCPATYVRSGTTCSRVRYKCSNTSTWGAWNASPPSCPQYWTCPGGAAGSGWYYSAPNCQGWKCQYAPYTQVNQSTAPACEYRCIDGTGLRAPQSNGWTGDMNCYQQPSFTLTCFWKNKPQFSETVTGNGQYCSNRDFDANEAGVSIGTPVRAVLTANYPGNSAWSSPPPGYRLNTQAVRWGWNNFPSRSAEDTVRVVGKPTVKIFGGDVAAGGDFIRSGVCNPAAAAMIVGWPHAPNYDASGTQFGAFSSSSVTGFSTAMIRANNATVPRSLAFANFPAPGGDTFGGNFDNNMPCAKDHYNDASPASLPNIGMPSINSSPTTPTPNGAYQGSGGQINQSPIIRNGQRIAVYATGNVYISGSGIRYNRTGWINTQDIPAFKLVVYGGNIYIAPTVTELSGTYVAQPNGAVGGNIYTCANNGSLIADSSLYTSCQNPLTVNGAFIAKKVHLQRTQGTAIRGETAERFNYLPELWLTSWPTTNSANEIKYDAMISLPPVL